MAGDTRGTGPLGGADDASPAGQSHPGVATRLGRFVVLDVLGTGGMGVVLGAYDPRLERKVALKVVRGGARSPAGHARLLREAQALARVAHPHVVPIHEVLELDDRIVLVMEYVAGRTLQDWVRDERPAWREIVRAYVQAGHGLAAAHAAGMVHRDFKPRNAVIGADGRVRVIDFGLARDNATEPTERAAPQADGGGGRALASTERLTPAGTMLGTPAYMAPEQFRRTDVGPKADIYSFCVSLSEALYGARPHASGHARFAAGEATRPPSEAAVPPRVWRVLRRGLSDAPDLRPASIEALLRELGALVEPALRRWTAAAGVALAGAMLAILAISHGEAQDAPCSGGAATLAPIWNARTRDEVTQDMDAAMGAYGREVAPVVVGALDRYATAWSASHRAVCMAHRRGEASEALLDKRMHCLDQHREALAAAVALVRDRGELRDPVALVLGLPPLARCVGPDLSAAREALPSDPVARQRLFALEAALARASAFERNGDYGGARAAATTVVHDAPQLARPALEAAASLLLGRVLLLDNDLTAASGPLRTALDHAIAADLPELAVEAIARRIYVEGVTGRLEPAAVAEQRALAESFLRRARDGGFARALLLNNVGVIYRTLGQRDLARSALRDAFAARAAVERPEPELTVIIENLAAVVDQPAERQALYDRAVHDAELTLGPHHPQTLRRRVVQAAGTAAPATRRDQLAVACALWDQFHPAMTSDRALCEQRLAGAELELEHRDQAAIHFAQAATLHTTNPLLGHLARGHAAHLSGQIGSALAELDAAETGVEPGPSRPWRVALRAEIDATRAEIALARGQRGDAMRDADRAVAALDGLDLRNELAWQATAARARVTAAIARRSLGGRAAAAQASSLLEAATRWYRTAGAGYADRLRWIARWQAGECWFEPRSPACR